MDIVEPLEPDPTRARRARVPRGVVALGQLLALVLVNEIVLFTLMPMLYIAGRMVVVPVYGVVVAAVAGRQVLARTPVTYRLVNGLCALISLGIVAAQYLAHGTMLMALGQLYAVLRR